MRWGPRVPGSCGCIGGERLPESVMAPINRRKRTDVLSKGVGHGRIGSLTASIRRGATGQSAHRFAERYSPEWGIVPLGSRGTPGSRKSAKHVHFMQSKARQAQRGLACEAQVHTPHVRNRTQLNAHGQTRIVGCHQADKMRPRWGRCIHSDRNGLDVLMCTSQDVDEGEML